MQKRTTVVWVLALALLCGIAAQAASAVDHEGVQRLIDDTRGTARVSTDAVTGRARFVRFEPGTMAHAMGRRGSAQDRAMEFFRAYGDAFGVARADSELVAVGSIRDGLGNEHAIFRQTHQGVPVFGAELRAHFNSRGQLYAANGSFVSDIKLDLDPSLGEDEAEARAVRAVIAYLAKADYAARGLEDQGTPGMREEDYLDLIAAETTLTVFRAGLVQGAAGRDHLTYEVEVRNEAISVREFVYVDAHSGIVVDRITGIHDAKFRRAFDAMGATAPGPNYPGSPFWVEGQPLPTGDVEADNMIYASGETYDLFFNAFGRDGFDGAGATMDAIFNRGNGCPNASWNGTFISFCPGLTTDDVTAHEWGHAYTDFTNNLIYQWQSGALNESYSDIWGEVVDLINGRGTDAPGGPRTDGACAVHTGGTDNSLRWLMGEDVNAPGLVGAIRDMWSPNCYNDPANVTDTLYWCSTGDNGGVHINSGVPNHAFALMVDGGNFNGYSGAGLGLTKASHIHWGAQNLLTLTSNFVEHADALDTSCSNLIGANLADLSTGLPSGQIITAGDCAEVSAISAAVEFRTAPTQCDFDTILDPAAPALCDGFGSVQTAAFEDFEGGALPAGWTVGSHDVVSPGTFDNPGWSVVGSAPAGGPAGSYSAFAPDLNAGDCISDIEAGAVSLDSPTITLPAGAPPHVAFDHWVATESGWDGGNVKVSVNGGAWTLVPGTAYSFNSYNDEIIGGGNDNPLNGEEAFTGTDEGSVGGSWGQSQVDLFGLAFPGDDVRLRFDLGVDGCFGLVGWYVDDVHVYTCSDEPLPICGDGLLDFGEACDDGNVDDGDGCSSTCQVEDGWVCLDPVPANPAGTNVVADGSFEGGVPNADWTAFSTFGGIAGFPLCGSGNGCPAASLANTGNWLVWIGGLSAGVTSYVEQTVTIPAAATDLTLYTWRGICDDPSDTLHVQLDGTDIGTVACDAVDGGWTQQTFSVAGFNDGGSHDLYIGGTVGGTNGTHSNFFVEDVELGDNTPIPATPSVCIPKVDDVACDPGIVTFDNGLPGSWAVTDNTGLGLVWSNIAGSGESGNYTGGGGDAASVSSDRYGRADFDTELITNSFSLADTTSASVDYLVNYQNFAAFDFLDVDVSTDGGGTWSNLLSWNEDHGGFRGLPGIPVSLNLAAYLGASDVRLRWRYYDPTTFDWDWYAQVDNVALTCNRRPDCDGAVATPDLLWPPNHKWKPIDIAVTDPDGDPVTITIDSIFQDESVNGRADGNTVPDGRGVGTSTARVRAERSGKGDGRVYHIYFTADDGQGGTCTGEVLVGVPHDQGSGSVPIDGGPLFDSTVAP